MDPLDDYLEYAFDVPEAQREQLFARLDREDPQLARRLRAAFEKAVRNPDFTCQPVRPAEDGRRADRVRSVSLRVGDLERAVRWYRDTFRCEVIEHGDHSAALAFDGIEIHLVGADDTARLTVVRPDVAAMGPSQRRPDGVRALHLVDPWGNAIEVVDR